MYECLITYLRKSTGLELMVFITFLYFSPVHELRVMPAVKLHLNMPNICLTSCIEITL